VLVNVKIEYERILLNPFFILLLLIMGSRTWEALLKLKLEK